VLAAVGIESIRRTKGRGCRANGEARRTNELPIGENNSGQMVMVSAFCAKVIPITCNLARKAREDRGEGVRGSRRKG